MNPTPSLPGLPTQPAENARRIDRRDDRPEADRPPGSAALFWYGLRLGVDLFVHGALRDSLPYLIRPVNYWRAVEYKTVLAEAGFRAGDRVLDVGSPKLLSAFLAERLGVEVYATDIEDYFVPKFTRIRARRRLSPERFHIQIEDGRQMSFPDGMFDGVYSISVLEHIPDDGDTECIRQIARVLKAGGRCVLTVPFSPTSRSEYKSDGFYWAKSSARHGSQVFYQRRYCEADLRRRLIEPSKLQLTRLAFIGERVLTNSTRELDNYLPAVTGPVQPLLSALMHTRPAASWRELAKPLCAVIVLDKPGRRF
jgi:SAM-dependent methyltransferase